MTNNELRFRVDFLEQKLSSAETMGEGYRMAGEELIAENDKLKEAAKSDNAETERLNTVIRDYREQLERKIQLVLKLESEMRDCHDRAVRFAETAAVSRKQSLGLKEALHCVLSAVQFEK